VGSQILVAEMVRTRFMCEDKEGLTGDWLLVITKKAGFC
jgi:hypothetical protein